MQILFSETKLKDILKTVLAEMGYDTMTPIQAKTLPLAIEGNDVLAQAKTGSGKTIAFSLPILNEINIDSLAIQSLILCPTRELAEQVCSEVRKVGRGLTNLKIINITGGIAEHHQEKSLSYGGHIVVGTPGRVLKLLKKEILKLDNLKHFVLDEADRMLDMGFLDDIKAIEQFLPNKKQTLLFSATFPEEIKTLAQQILIDAKEVSVDTTHDDGSIVEEFYLLDSHKDKYEALKKVLGSICPERTIIFCKTKVICDNLVKDLAEDGIYSASIHGDLPQNQRTAVLVKFENQSLGILVATDVAARGLDIQDLPLVVNFDFPRDSEVYTHRVGRTGRAGESGLAISFLAEGEEFKVEDLERFKGLEDPIELQSISKFKDSDYFPVPTMRTLYIRGGKKNKLRPGDILGALVNEAGIQGQDVGKIKVLPTVSYVAVKRELANIAIEKLNAGKIKNRKFKVGIA